MTREEQAKFVEQLTESVKNDILKAISEGRVPESWDGYELRQLLQDKFKEANFVIMSRGRKRDYNNTVYVNNL